MNEVQPRGWKRFRKNGTIWFYLDEVFIYRVREEGGRIAREKHWGQGDAEGSVRAAASSAIAALGRREEL